MADEKKEIPSAEKILDLLDAFMESEFRPMTVPEIMEKSGLKRNSCDRLLSVLATRGYIIRNERKEWLLTPKLIRFSEKYAEFCLNAIAQS